MKNKGLKYLLILSAMIGFLVAIGLLFMSCEKVDDDYCWTCHFYYYERQYLNDGEIFEKRYEDSLALCGYTERDIQKYERYRTVKPYSISTCGDHIRWQDCLCIKKEN
ncbi:MAG: hypothetical protein GYA51_11960 [Candidatus Methanofastidiosa archaeon]|nr:hypothetical protein [Candidatus Methanofastidiosa archaeon]